MVKSFTLSLFLVITSFPLSWAETEFTFQQNLLNSKRLDPEIFESYLDSVISGKWEADSLLKYSAWLTQHQTSFLSAENELIKAYFYLENANIQRQLEKYEDSYSNVNNAYAAISQKKLSSLRYRVLQVGVVFSGNHGDYKTAIKFLKKVEDSGIYNFNSTKLSEVILDIADFYWMMHKYDSSMIYCKKVRPLITLQNYKEGKVRLLMTMYNNSHFKSADSTSTDYLTQALEVAKSVSDSTLIANVYEMLGLSSYRKGNQQQAIKYYKRSRQFEKEKGSPSDISTAIYLQLSYSLADSIEKVGAISEFIIREANERDYYNALGNAYKGRAWYFAKTGVRDSATHYLDRAFEHRQALTEKSEASPGFYTYLYEVADILGDNERALKYLSLAHSQYVQLSRESNAEQMNQIRANFDYQLQKERIQKLSLANKLEKEKNARQKLVIAIVLVLLVAGVIFWIFARKKYMQLRGSYRALVKKNIELDKLHTRLSETERELESPKNGNGIKDEEKIYLRLKALLEKEKIYKQKDLSASKLSKKLRTNTSYLSSIINNRFEESFKSLINHYRINEARRLLVLPEYANYSIEGIAEEVGYQSRSTFYQSFKQITGLTPTQYIENISQVHNNET